MSDLWIQLDKYTGAMEIPGVGAIVNTTSYSNSGALSTTSVFVPGARIMVPKDDSQPYLTKEDRLQPPGRGVRALKAEAETPGETRTPFDEFDDEDEES